VVLVIVLPRPSKNKHVSEFEKLFDAVKEKMTAGMKGGNKATAATSTEVVDVLPILLIRRNRSHFLVI
jgi:hypothetical protein